MKIAFGNDHAGCDMKLYLMEHLKGREVECVDLGGSADAPLEYPAAGERVGRAVAAGECDLGVVICGTGIGISIAANKVRGVRAAACSEPYSAKMSRLHNNANVLAMGERVVGRELAAMIMDVWLETESEAGRHAMRVDMIRDIEARTMK